MGKYDGRGGGRLRQADVIMEAGNVDKAIEAYKDVLSIDSENLYALAALTELFRLKGSWMESKRFSTIGDVVRLRKPWHEQSKSLYLPPVPRVTPPPPSKNARPMRSGSAYKGSSWKSSRPSTPTHPSPNRSTPYRQPLRIVGTIPSTHREFINKEKDMAIKAVLPHTWSTFFGRFDGLRIIQRLTIPVVLERKNAIVIASTASGKTEAVFAPLMELLLANQWAGLSVIYISPTKALVNDLRRRLEPIVAPLNITVAQRDGDTKDFSEYRPQNVLVTTPESLDSMLGWKKGSLRGVKAVVIDELHMLDGNYRGDQLRIVLRRMRMEMGLRFNVYGVSATVSAPEAMAARYMSEPKVIQANGGRGMEYTIVDTLQDALAEVKKRAQPKALVFVNTPSEAEEIALQITRFDANSVPVVVHHGQLDKEPRLAAEQLLKEGSRAICVCTSTLEVGVDIGDIDVVVLARVPRSISSLAQRIGRGKRRAEKISVIAIGHADIATYYEKMFQALMRSKYEVTNYSFDPSVIAQQILSSVSAKSTPKRVEFYVDLFEGICSERDLVDIINHLKREGYLKEEDGRLFPGPRAIDLQSKVYSNIPKAPTISVIDFRDGQHIGHIDSSFDNVFVLSGKAWMVKERRRDMVLVEPITNSSVIAKFATYESKGSFFSILPIEIQSREASK